MDLRRLRNFVVLADTLNFRLAAQRLHLTQPAVSRSIVKLETELGAPLFLRDKRQVSLTAVGQELLAQAQEILDRSEQLRSSARAVAARSSEALRIGIYADGLAELTHPVLWRFRELYPQVDVSFTEITFDRGVDPLLNRDIDIALLRAPCAVPSVNVVQLFAEPAEVLLFAEHRLAGESQLRMEDLLEERWNSLPANNPAPWSGLKLAQFDSPQEEPTFATQARTELEISTLVAYSRVLAIAPASMGRRRPPGIAPVQLAGARFIGSIAYREDEANEFVRPFVDVARTIARSEISRIPKGEPVA